MQWSFKIGKLFGIDVFVHFTFLLLLGFIGLSHWLKTRELADAMAGVGFFVALFACVTVKNGCTSHCVSESSSKAREPTSTPSSPITKACASLLKTAGSSSLPSKTKDARFKSELVLARGSP